MRARRLAGVLATTAGVALSACALNTVPRGPSDASTPPPLDVPAVLEASRTEASAPDRAPPAPDAAPDAPSAGFCNWAADSTVQLTRGPGVRLPRALAFSSSGLLLAWQGPGLTSPAETATWLQRLEFDGTPRGAPIRLPGTGAETDVQLAPDAISTAFARSSAAGCELTLLDRDAAPTSTSAVLPGRGCAAVVRGGTPGFTVVTSSAPTASSYAIGLVRYDSELRAIDAERPLVTSATPFDVVRATPYNGATLLSTVADARLTLRTFDDRGMQTGAVAEQLEGGPLAGRLEVAFDSFLTIALAAWNVPGFGVTLRSYSISTGFAGPPIPLAGARSDRSVNLALVDYSGEMVVVWTESDARSGGGGVRVRARALSATGEALHGDIVEVGSFGPDGAGPTYPLAVYTSRGVLVVYFAARAPEPEMQIYATLLRCDPR